MRFTHQLQYDQNENSCIEMVPNEKSWLVKKREEWNWTGHKFAHSSKKWIFIQVVVLWYRMGRWHPFSYLWCLLLGNLCLLFTFLLARRVMTAWGNSEKADSLSRTDYEFLYRWKGQWSWVGIGKMEECVEWKYLTPGAVKMGTSKRISENCFFLVDSAGASAVCQRRKHKSHHVGF